MLEGLTKAFERDNYVCCLVTSLKIYQISADYSGRECTCTPPALLPKCTKFNSLGKKKTFSSPEKDSGISENKHFLTVVDEMFRRFSEAFVKKTKR